MSISQEPFILPYMRHFLRTLFPNTIGSFWGWKLFFLAGAIIATVAIVQTGTDWRYLLAMRDPDLNKMFFPAIIIGGFLPISLPLFLIVYGRLFDLPHITLTGWAVGQAALIGSMLSSTLKAFTGRMQPDLFNLAVDSSRGFQFGFFEHGIFWGWPSSHTTIAFAMAFTLIALYPKNKHLLFYSIIYALYVGIGVSLSIHWLSEFVAGAFIGTAIGMTVGASYARIRAAR